MGATTPAVRSSSIDCDSLGLDRATPEWSQQSDNSSDNNSGVNLAEPSLQSLAEPLVPEAGSYGNAAPQAAASDDDYDPDLSEEISQQQLVVLGPVRPHFDREARFEAQRATSIRYRQLAMQSLTRETTRIPTSERQNVWCPISSLEFPKAMRQLRC